MNSIDCLISILFYFYSYYFLILAKSQSRGIISKFPRGKFLKICQKLATRVPCLSPEALRPPTATLKHPKKKNGFPPKMCPSLLGEVEDFKGTSRLRLREDARLHIGHRRRAWETKCTMESSDPGPIQETRTRKKWIWQFWYTLKSVLVLFKVKNDLTTSRSRKNGVKLHFWVVLSSFMRF